MSKEKTLKKELGILAGIRNCLKSKGSVEVKGSVKWTVEFSMTVSEAVPKTVPFGSKDSRLR